MKIGFYTYGNKSEMEEKAECLYSAGCDIVYKARKSCADEAFKEVLLEYVSVGDEIILYSLYDFVSEHDQMAQQISINLGLACENAFIGVIEDSSNELYAIHRLCDKIKQLQDRGTLKFGVDKVKSDS